MRLVLVPFICAAASAAAEPARYELDPAHTTIAFLVDHVGYAKTLGLFAEMTGSFVYDMETQDLSDVRVVVSTASLETLNDARDNHVLSSDFLDVESHPQMVFVADGGTPTGETTGTVEGELTLLGQTGPLTLDVTLNKAEVYPFGHQRFTLGLTVRGSLMRSDWGMDYGVANGLVGDEVTLIIEAEAMRVEG
ncbi:YceI family protein [Jannaschia aquimarina]|uniref:YceI_2 protein n=1 Tax=Jannaschia aquimarina TaxID=935700 RepID=A0A0D1ECY1_9RHOB|nr:YceI family protein [Jannaschia aquimarina]KIT14786.1 Protein YceI [Jannaschia aquimarina]SNT43824.1 Polyisoprenoid-binding protein YceI [Jannaschia aquimarina]